MKTKHEPFELTEDLMHQLFAALFEHKDFTLPRSMWGPDTVDHFLALGISVRGPDALEAFFRSLHAAASDIAMTVENVVVSGNQAVVQWQMDATYDGEPFQGIDSTGRRITLRGCDVLVFDADGILEKNTIYYDGAEFARQIGMLPARGGVGERAMLAAFNAQTRVRRALS